MSSMIAQIPQRDANSLNVRLYAPEDMQVGTDGPDTANAIIFTQRWLEGWARVKLDHAAMQRLADAIEYSSIPDAIGTIVSDALGIKGMDPCPDCGSTDITYMPENDHESSATCLGCGTEWVEDT
jgi:hypothetical protein